MTIARPRALFEAVDLRNVGMVERRKRLRLVFEPGQPIGIVDQRVGEDFDRDLPIEMEITGAVDLTHAAGTERILDHVRTESGTGRQRH
jgi:hypothetical protein